MIHDSYLCISRDRGKIWSALVGSNISSLRFQDRIRTKLTKPSEINLLQGDGDLKLHPLDFRTDAEILSRQYVIRLLICQTFYICTLVLSELFFQEFTHVFFAAKLITRAFFLSSLGKFIRSPSFIFFSLPCPSFMNLYIAYVRSTILSRLTLLQF